MQRVDVPRPGIVFATAILLVSLASGSAVAQEDAGIIGVVTDESGAVLPGVTITVRSPSLQISSMTAVSDARGEFRITPLPIGTYVVEYTLSGFQGVKREAVRLTVGFTAKVDAQLKVAKRLYAGDVCDRLARALLGEQVDSAPVGELGHGEPGDVAQRLLVVQ